MADVARRLGGLFGQRLHLGRNHRKAAARIAGARRFDGGVERQQVGLARQWLLMSSTTSPIRAAALASSATRSLVLRACATAELAIFADSWTCRLISLTDDDISSVDDATACTLVDAVRCSNDCSGQLLARSAVAVSAPADSSSLFDAEETLSTILPTARSNVPASSTISRLRDAAARLS